MNQAKRGCAHLERILLICGEQNSGKSRLLRQMLSDRRLLGDAPEASKIPPILLSRERRLSVRCTSPHEYGETQTQFHKKIQEVAKTTWKDGFWRFNYACAVQPKPSNKMGDIVRVCEGLVRKFAPERIRVVQLSPDKEGDVSSCLNSDVIDQLRQLEDVEVITIDARKRSGVAAEPGNIRVLADFFDFS